MSKRPDLDNAEQYIARVADELPTAVLNVIASLIAYVRELQDEIADLRERPCNHRWQRTEEGERCVYCGVVASTSTCPHQFAASVDQVHSRVYRVCSRCGLREEL